MLMESLNSQESAREAMSLWIVVCVFFFFVFLNDFHTGGPG